jgi:sugar lactone lactonase YvrE
LRPAKSHFSDRQWWALLILSFLISFTASCSKRAEPAPKPQAPPPFEFLGAWGDKGEDPGKLDQPVAFATDAMNRVFFVDPAAELLDKFESGGTPLLSFQDSRLRYASGIAVDSGGAIYVADATHGIVMIFFPDGTFLRSVGTQAQPHFSGPLGISVDGDGNLYVPDPAHSRVEKFDSRGRQVKFWAAAKAAEPDDQPSSVATAQDGSVFVAYSKSGRVEKYTSDGSLVTAWNTVDTPSPDSSPMTGFAVAGQFVLTMTAASPQIRVWTLDGQHKLDADLGEHLGTIPISAPQLAVTPHSELLVFDPSAPHVFWFRMHLDTRLETKEQK